MDAKSITTYNKGTNNKGTKVGVKLTKDIIMMDNNAGVSTEMPKYKSHKEVWALKIKSIKRDVDIAIKEKRETDGSAMITPEDKGYAPFKVDHDFIRRMKNTDEDLGYYVVYKDGYKSWSPTKAFEEGYTKI